MWRLVSDPNQGFSFLGLLRLFRCFLELPFLSCQGFCLEFLRVDLGAYISNKIPEAFSQLHSRGLQQGKGIVGMHSELGKGVPPRTVGYYRKNGGTMLCVWNQSLEDRGCTLEKRVSVNIRSGHTDWAYLEQGFIVPGCLPFQFGYVVGESPDALPEPRYQPVSARSGTRVSEL